MGLVFPPLRKFLLTERILTKILDDPRLVAQILKGPDFLSRLVSHHEFTDFVFQNQNFLDRILVDARFESMLCGKPDFLSRLVSHHEFTDFVFQNQNFLDRILVDARFKRFFLDREQVVEAVCMSHEFSNLLFASEKGMKYILLDDRSIAQFIKNNSLRDKLVRDPRFLNVLASDEVFLRRFLAEELSLNHLLSNQRLLGRIFLDQRFFDRLVENAPFLKRLLSDRRVVQFAAEDHSFQNELLESKHLFGSLLQSEQTSKKFLMNRQLWENVAINPDCLGLLYVTDAFWKSNALQERIIAQSDFVKQWNQFSTILGKLSPEREGKVRSSIRRIQRPGQVRSMLSEVICEESTIKINNLQLNFVEPSTTWTLLHEIFCNEDYFFEAETEEPLIFDCGAHCGFSIAYFKQLYPQSRIVAFEPVEKLLDIAKQNVKLNALTGVIFQKVALSNSKGNQSIFSPTWDSMGSSLQFRKGWEGRSIEREEVEVRPLSEFLDQPVDFLKMDIEGAEADVLEEAKGKLHYVKNLFVEVHEDGAKESDRLLRILSVLRRNGFIFHVSKSFNTARETRQRPQTALGGRASFVIHAKRS